MAQFVVPDRDTFDDRDALVRILVLLRDLFREIWEDRDVLLPASVAAGLPRAIDFAMGQLGALIERVADRRQALGTAEEIEDFGLTGDALRFKMLVIAFANDRSREARNRVLEGVTDGRNRGRWRFYRRALGGTLAAIDGPLESLTKLLGAKEGVVEFKKAIEVALGLAS